jgi:hypothetical protein
MAAKQNTQTSTQDAAAEQMPKERPKTESGFHFERHYLLTLNKQKWRRRSPQIQVQCAQFARFLLQRRKKASTPERARARERGRNKLKQQIECGIIWIQNSPTRKMFLKCF